MSRSGPNNPPPVGQRACARSVTRSARERADLHAATETARLSFSLSVSSACSVGTSPIRQP